MTYPSGTDWLQPPPQPQPHSSDVDMSGFGMDLDSFVAALGMGGVGFSPDSEPPPDHRDSIDSVSSPLSINSSSNHNPTTMAWPASSFASSFTDSPVLDPFSPASLTSIASFESTPRAPPAHPKHFAMWSILGNNQSSSPSSVSDSETHASRPSINTSTNDVESILQAFGNQNSHSLGNGEIGTWMQQRKNSEPEPMMQSMSHSLPTHVEDLIMQQQRVGMYNEPHVQLDGISPTALTGPSHLFSRPPAPKSVSFSADALCFPQWDMGDRPPTLADYGRTSRSHSFSGPGDQSYHDPSLDPPNVTHFGFLDPSLAFSPRLASLPDAIDPNVIAASISSALPLSKPKPKPANEIVQSSPKQKPKKPSRKRLSHSGPAQGLASASASTPASASFLAPSSSVPTSSSTPTTSSGSTSFPALVADWSQYKPEDFKGIKPLGRGFSKGKEDAVQGNFECENCAQTSTPLWRRSEKNELLCNACGLYIRTHGTHRPVNSATKDRKGEGAKKRRSAGEFAPRPVHIAMLLVLSESSSFPSSSPCFCLCYILYLVTCDGCKPKPSNERPSDCSDCLLLRKNRPRKSSMVGVEVPMVVQDPPRQSGDDIGERRHQQPPGGARQPPRGSPPQSWLEWIPEQADFTLSRPSKTMNSNRRRTVDGIDLPRHDDEAAELWLDQGHDVGGKKNRRLSQGVASSRRPKE